MDRRFAMEAEPQPSPPGNDYQSELSLLSNDITMEIFFVDRPLDGFGAVEVTDPPLFEEQSKEGA
jgi:hypothetical protein